MIKQTLTELDSSNSAPRNNRRTMVDEQGCLRDELDPQFASPRHVAYRCDEEEIVFFSDHSDDDDDDQSSSDGDSSCLDYFTAGGDTTDEEEWHDAFDNCSNDHLARSLFAQEDNSCCEDNDNDDYDDLGLIGEMDSIHLRKSQLLEDDEFEKIAFGVFGEKDSLHRRERAAKFLRQKATTTTDLEQQLDGPFGEHDSLHGRRISEQINASEMKISAQDEKEEAEKEETSTTLRKQPYRLLMRRVSQEEEEKQDASESESNSLQEQLKLLSSSLGATTASRTHINRLDEYLFKILETMEDEMQQRDHDGDEQDTAMDSSSRTNYYNADGDDDESDYDDDDCVSLYNWEDDEPSEASSSSSSISKGMADSVIPPLPALPERIPRQDARAA